MQEPDVTGKLAGVFLEYFNAGDDVYGGQGQTETKGLLEQPSQPIAATRGRAGNAAEAGRKG